MSAWISSATACHRSARSASPCRRASRAPRSHALVSGEVIEGVLVQILLPADPVHRLEIVALLGGVGDEVEEVVRLVVEPQRVQTPQGEGGVADPAVAIVPVPFASGGLRQRGGGRGQKRAGGNVRQALEGERAPLQVRAPRVVGELPL